MFSVYDRCNLLWYILCHLNNICRFNCPGSQLSALDIKNPWLPSLSTHDTIICIGSLFSNFSNMYMHSHFTRKIGYTNRFCTIFKFDVLYNLKSFERITQSGPHVFKEDESRWFLSKMEDMSN